ncbi:MAG: right-handed parallel beta-helix repeat-containing protein [Phycisphaerales bacterium JB038]
MAGRRWLAVVCSLLALGATAALAAPPLRLHAAPDGAADASGATAEPLSVAGAIARLSDLIEEGLPPGGVQVVLASGRYQIEDPITLGTEFAGAADRPIVIRADDNAFVVFDGSLPIDATAFAPVTDPEERALLAAGAADDIVAVTLDDPRLIEALAANLMLNLTVDGQNYLPAVFPNEGYARLHNTAVEPEVCPPGIPVGKQAYGVRAGTEPHREPGKPAGWKGSLTEPRGAWATLAAGEEEMAGAWTQWERELARDNTRHQAPGFLEADWLLSSIPFVEADAERQALRLSRVLSYGWAWRKTKQFRVFGLLCELDRPGEWHFDPASRRLYLYPPGELTAETQVSIPVADGFLRLTGAAHVELRGLHVRNLASGWAFDIAGADNTLAASSVRCATAGGAQVGGVRNRVSGCDFVDLNRHVRLAGGRRGPSEIVSGRNVVENCHFYQRRFRHQKVNIGIVGVGNIFRNNLIHNSLGQAATVNGNDHLIECNEFFNVGYDEGDGGAIYAGADLTGYGITFRHNFFHHLMGVPGKVGRHGIHLDDLQAGAICEGNVFYKSANMGISMNGGAGHRLLHNVFLTGRFGAHNRGSGGHKNWQRATRIHEDPDNPHKGSKEDYLGRAIAITGPDGWTKPPWSERYPLMNQVLSDTGEFGRFWPIRCEIRANFYCDNDYNRFVWDRMPPQAAAKSVVEDELVISPDAFVDYEALDLRLSDAAPQALRAAAIPFGRIGLYLGEDRAEMPAKAHYRQAIQRFFAGIRSMPGTTKKIDTAAIVETGPIDRRAD